MNALANTTTTARTLNQQQAELDAALLAAIGFANTGNDVFTRSQPYLVQTLADLMPTTALLDTYSPQVFCTIRNAAHVAPRGRRGGERQPLLPAAHTAVDRWHRNPYVYPDNLPRVNGRGGPGGKPGCWQPITRDLWPAPYLVMDSGNSIAPYNHFELGQPLANEYVWGRQVRGEHDQPMNITGTAVRLARRLRPAVLHRGSSSWSSAKCASTAPTSYSADFSNCQRFTRRPVRPRLGRGGRQGQEGRAGRGRQADPGGLLRRPLGAALSVDDRADPLPGPDRQPLPGNQPRDRARTPKVLLPPGGFIPLSRTQPALDLDALIGGFQAAVPGAGSAEGQHHRLVDHHRLPGRGRHHQRHPRPDRAADRRLWPKATRRSAR